MRAQCWALFALLLGRACAQTAFNTLTVPSFPAVPQAQQQNSGVEQPWLAFGPTSRSGPVPTHTWWSAWTQHGDGSDASRAVAVEMNPYRVKVLKSGLLVTPPHTANGDFSCLSCNPPNQDDAFDRPIEISATGGLSSVVVESWDELTVTLAWNDGAMRAVLLQGSPYITVSYNGASPSITWRSEAVKGLTVDASSTSAKVAVDTTQNWKIWTSAACTFVNTTNSVSVSPSSPSPSAPLTLRLAVLHPKWAAPFFSTASDMDPARTEALFDSYANAYPTSGCSAQLGTTDSQDGATRALLRLKFAVSYLDPAAAAAATAAAPSTPGLLLFALPHHRQRSVFPANPDSAAQVVWSSPRGEVRTVVVPLTASQGHVWDLAYDMPPVGFSAGTVASTYAQAIANQALAHDANVNLTTPESIQRFGPVLGDAARTLLIASELAGAEGIAGTATAQQLHAASDSLASRMRTALRGWLRVSDVSAAVKGLVYDSVYGGIVSLAAAKGTKADAMGWKEDRNSAYWNHLAHYGPIIYAAAALAHHDAAALDSSDLAAVAAIVRSVASPDHADPLFPFARHMDWWAGHSWASGIIMGGSDVSFGRFQESSSVAVAAYHAIALYGKATGNAPLQRWGQLLAAVEIAGAKTYWHVPASGSPAFPHDDTRAWYGSGGGRTAGVVYQSRTERVFQIAGESAHPMVLEGLQWVPFLPGASDALLGDATWLDDSVRAATSAVDPLTTSRDAWATALAMAQAQSRPEDAWALVQALPSDENCCSSLSAASWLPKISKTAAMYWVATRSSSGISAPMGSPSPSPAIASAGASPAASPIASPTSSPTTSSTASPSPSPSPSSSPAVAVVVELPGPSSTPIAFNPLSPNVPASAPSARLQQYDNAVHTEWWGTWWHRPIMTAFPHPTNKWWSSWTHNSSYTGRVGEEQVGMHPWRAKVLSTWLQVFPPQPYDIKPGYMTSAADRAMHIWALEGLTSRTLVNGTELGATFKWTDGDKTGSMTATLLQGMPYVTVVYDNLTPRVVPQVGTSIAEVNGVEVFPDAAPERNTPFVTEAATSFRIRMNQVTAGGSRMTYKLYFSSPVRLHVVGEYRIDVTDRFNGVMRMALVESRLIPAMTYADPDAVERVFDTYADVYPTGATLTYGYQDAAQSPTGRERGIVRIAFTTASMSGSAAGQLMMMSLPHQRPRLYKPTVPASPPFTIYDLRGELVPVVGSDWVLHYDLVDVDFSDKPITDPALREAVADQLLLDASSWKGLVNNTRNQSVYFFGGDMHAVGRMALLCEELAPLVSASRSEKLRAAASKMHASLAVWLSSRLTTNVSVPSSLVYDRTWGGLIPYSDAANNRETNFGNRIYNDHHYHYGYYLYAAAALGKANPSWVEAHREALLAVLRDYANPNQADPHFPFARMMDWWGGHSWAGGFNAMGDGKNQESTSEAVMGYYAVGLLGRVLGDADLQRWGQLLAAIEIDGAHTYYQSTAAKSVYPAPFNEGKVVGILWSSKVDYATWFGANPAFIHGIQYIPFLPISSTLLRKGWLAESYPLANPGTLTLTSANDAGWHLYMTMAQSYLDPAGAWTRITRTLADVNTFGEWSSHPKSVVMAVVASQLSAQLAASAPIPAFTELAPSLPTIMPAALQQVTNEETGAWVHKPTLTAFPHPTNTWWSSWTHNSSFTGRVGEEQVGMHPWRAKVLTAGLTVIPPQPLTVQPNEVTQGVGRTFTIGAAEGLTSRSVASSNELGATFVWSAAAGSGTMRCTLLQGMPYITAVFAGLTPLIALATPMRTINGLTIDTDSTQNKNTPFDVAGKSFKIVVNDVSPSAERMTYKLYFSSEVSLRVTGERGLQLTSPFNGVVRVALLESRMWATEGATSGATVVSAADMAAAEALYDANADVYPTGATLTYGYQTADRSPTGVERGIVRISFATASMSGSATGQLMMMSLPHQRPRLVTPAAPTSPAFTILDLRGELVPVVGAPDWYLSYSLPDISFNSNPIANTTRRDAVISTLLADSTSWTGVDDPRPASVYFGGSDLHALGRMALLCDELAAATPARAAELGAAAASLRGKLAQHLDARIVTNAGVASSLVYDTTWGGLVPYGDSTGKGDDNFGSVVYNDHHTHLGYYLYAATALAKGDAVWRAANRERMLALVRDYANPNRADPWFPFARHMDWWGGHSWAGGLHVYGDGKNQGSTSEAVMGYYAVGLLGRVLGDADLQRWGQLLAAIEIDGAHTYYQSTAARSVYAQPYSNNKVVGVLWSTKADFSTWYGSSSPAIMHGVQYRPFLPISDALLRKEWVAESYPVASAGVSNLPITDNGGWHHYLAMAQSLVDPQAAWDRLMTTLEGSWYYGGWASHPKSVVLHFVASRPGFVDPPSSNTTSPAPSPAAASSPATSPETSPAATTTATSPATAPATSIPAPASSPVPAAEPPSFTELAPSLPTSMPAALQQVANEETGAWVHKPTLTAFPHPTNTWWSSWTHNSSYTGRVGEEQVGMHPWRAKVLAAGLTVIPPQPLSVQPTYIVQGVGRTFTIGAAEGLTSRSVASSNELGATFVWSAAAGSGTMRCTLLQGMPYITAVFAGLTPLIALATPMRTINGLTIDTDSIPTKNTPFTVTSNTFKIVVNDVSPSAERMTYKLYFSSEVSLRVTGEYGLQLTSPFNGVVRVALLESRMWATEGATSGATVVSAADMAAAEALYDANADVYPTGATLTYGYQTADRSPTGVERGIVRIAFTTASMSGSATGQLMMMSLPHQRPRLVTPAAPTSPAFTIRDLRGDLVPVVGALEWYLAYDLPAVSFDGVAITDAARRKAVIDALLVDSTSFNALVNEARKDDVYWGGTDLHALGRMAVLADQLAQLEPARAAELGAAAASLRGKLAQHLDARIVTNAGVASSLVYDTTWGGLVPYRDSTGKVDANFGSVLYNNHHTHLGYYLYAATALAKGDAAWRAANRERMLALVRDYANPNRADPWFPFARHMDWWGGHSWAGGLQVYSEGKDQGSTSEAVMGYYAVGLLGRVLGDADLQRWGQLLAAIEIDGAHTYYQSTAAKSVYPAPFSNNKVVGVLWSTKVDHSNWINNDNSAMLHGVQYAPFLPISDVLLRKEWLAESYPLANANAASLSAQDNGGWLHFLAMAQAQLDPAAAWARVTTTLAGSNFYGGWPSHPRSVVLYTIASRPELNDAPVPSPAVSPAATVTPSPASSPTSTVTPSPAPSPTTAAAPSPTPSPTAAATPSPPSSPTAAATPSPTASPSAAASPSPTPSPTTTINTNASANSTSPTAAAPTPSPSPFPPPAPLTNVTVAVTYNATNTTSGTMVVEQVVTVPVSMANDTAALKALFPDATNVTLVGTTTTVPVTTANSTTCDTNTTSTISSTLATGTTSGTKRSGRAAASRSPPPPPSAFPSPPPATTNSTTNTTVTCLNSTTSASPSPSPAPPPTTSSVSSSPPPPKNGPRGRRLLQQAPSCGAGEPTMGVEVYVPADSAQTYEQAVDQVVASLDSWAAAGEVDGVLPCPVDKAAITTMAVLRVQSVVVVPLDGTDPCAGLGPGVVSCATFDGAGNPVQFSQGGGGGAQQQQQPLPTDTTTPTPDPAAAAPAAGTGAPAAPGASSGSHVVGIAVGCAVGGTVLAGALVAAAVMSRRKRAKDDAVSEGSLDSQTFIAASATGHKATAVDAFAPVIDPKPFAASPTGRPKSPPIKAFASHTGPDPTAAAAAAGTRPCTPVETFTPTTQDGPASCTSSPHYTPPHSPQPATLPRPDAPAAPPLAIGAAHGSPTQLSPSDAGAGDAVQPWSANRTSQQLGARPPRVMYPSDDGTGGMGGGGGGGGGMPGGHASASGRFADVRVSASGVVLRTSSPGAGGSGAPLFWNRSSKRRIVPVGEGGALESPTGRAAQVSSSGAAGAPQLVEEEGEGGAAAPPTRTSAAGAAQEGPSAAAQQ